MSTEAQLSTNRLNQILSSHRLLLDLPASRRPSLANVRAMPVQDLEAQEHIVEYQLPIAVRRYNAGLVVIDSVAANYRAEHGSSIPRDLANRATRLAKLGKILRDLAIKENICVVVANQVSDRFEFFIPNVTLDLRSSSPAMSSSPAPQPRPEGADEKSIFGEETMSLDHQQRFFSGWGDEGSGHHSMDLKTPALGLGWTNQIAARIVLKMEGTTRSVTQSTGGPDHGYYSGGNIWKDRKRRRFLSLVFAPWAGTGSAPVEFEIRREGIVSVSEEKDADADADGEAEWKP